MKTLQESLTSALNESKLIVNRGTDFDSMPRNVEVYYDSLTYMDMPEDEAEDAEYDDAELTRDIIRQINNEYWSFLAVDDMTLTDAIKKNNKADRYIAYWEDLEDAYDKLVIHDGSQGYRIFIEDGKLIFEYLNSGVKRPRYYIYALTEDGKQAVLDHDEDLSNIKEWLQPDMIYVIKTY